MVELTGISARKPTSVDVGWMALVCSPAENNMGRKSHIKEYKGVHWHTRDCVWNANIRVNKRLIHLGSFKNKLEAAKAYDEAAKRYFGEFACLNLG
jgi:hypothetical protein